MASEREVWYALVDAYVDRCFRVQTAPRASELAYQLRLSPVRLTREFRRKAGDSISGYMKRRQVERAKYLLRATDATAASIAYAAGFGTIRTFYRAFRRATGYAPDAYRRRARDG
ncbi:MAG TPA: AraC family transcriptional regulator [Thermoanaerobaculia bacterium]|jgi:AraC-like DNA-binding protein